jgi:hypothetical protein
LSAGAFSHLTWFCSWSAGTSSHLSWFCGWLAGTSSHLTSGSVAGQLEPPLI